MRELAVWEVKVGRVIKPIHVVAPADASLDSIATTAHLAHADENVKWAEDNGWDVGAQLAAAARRDVSAVTRCDGHYVAHPEVVVTGEHQHGD